MTRQAWFWITVLIWLGPLASAARAGGKGAHQDCFAGTLVDHTHNQGEDRRIWSAALCEKRDLYVYLPPGFDPTQRYPVMIWLHGNLQNEQSFVDSELPDYDAAMAAGRMPPTIIAIPDGSLHGQGIGILTPQTMFVNSKLGRFEDYVVQDVWGFVQEHYPICPDRHAHVMAGFSGGAAAAYRIAIKYRSLFAVVCGIAPPLNFRWLDCHGRYFSDFDPDCWGWRTRIRPWAVVGRFYGVIVIRLGGLITPLYGRGPKAVEMLSLENPVEILDTMDVKPGELSMYIAYGGKDQFNLDAQVQSFLFVAKQRHLHVTVGYDPKGKHDDALVQEFVPEVIAWLSPQLAPFAPPNTCPKGTPPPAPACPRP